MTNLVFVVDKRRITKNLTSHTDIYLSIALFALQISIRLAWLKSIISIGGQINAKR